MNIYKLFWASTSLWTCLWSNGPSRVWPCGLAGERWWPTTRRVRLPTRPGMTPPRPRTAGIRHRSDPLWQAGSPIGTTLRRIPRTGWKQATLPRTSSVLYINHPLSRRTRPVSAGHGICRLAASWGSGRSWGWNPWCWRTWRCPGRGTSWTWLYW